MRFYKFIYDRVHGVDILVGLSLLTNHSKTLEALL
jgi:hypothetical protein